MHLFSTTLSTPAGPFTMIAGDDGIHASGFTTEINELRAHLAAGARASEIQPSNDLGDHSRAVLSYFEGELSAIDGLPVVQQGPTYYVAAWKALRAIEPGKPISYRELAARLGNAAAPRAAGTACGRNAVALIVPCHRVVRSDGGLGGFAWGLQVKRWLLAHEAGGR